MGGDKGEACDARKSGKDVLTYFSRVVLFHITGFLPVIRGFKRLGFLMTDKISVKYVP